MGSQDTAAHQIAEQYVGISDQFLTDGLGRSYTIGEVAQFTQSTIALLLASAYANLREHTGKEESEAWLKRTLSVAAANVRIMGADALLKFDVSIKDMPNTLHARKMQEAAVSGPQVEIKSQCTCLLEDGACAVCRTQLTDLFRYTFQFMMKMGEKAEKTRTMCQVCMTSQTDRALSDLVPEMAKMKEMVPPDNQELFEQQIFALFNQIAQSHGAREIPFTQKAWEAATKKT